MGKINLVRVILGGLLSGLVINIGEYVLNSVILMKDWDDAMRSLGRPALGNEAITLFVVSGFILGIIMVWAYAAIRPRFGAGPKTAICAGLLTWAMAYLFPSIGFAAVGLFPLGLIVYGTVWGLFEVPIACVAGAWLYKEEA